MSTLQEAAKKAAEEIRDSVCESSGQPSREVMEAIILRAYREYEAALWRLVDGTQWIDGRSVWGAFKGYSGEWIMFPAQSFADGVRAQNYAPATHWRELPTPPEVTR